MNPWIEATGWTLIHFVWQGTLLTLATAAALGLCRRSAAQVRYVVACLGLTAMLVTAAATAVAVTFPGGASAFSTDRVPPAGRFASPIAASIGPAGQPFFAASEAVRRAANPRQLLPVVVWVWLAGVTVLMARLAAGCWRIHRLRAATMAAPLSSWQPAAERLARRLRVAVPFRIVESAVVDAPILVGWLQPLVVLPLAAMAHMTAAQVEALVAHEITHIRRRDYAINLLQTIAEALLFFHPGVWWVSRRIRQEREHCCDDAAIAVAGEATAYAEALMALASWREREFQPSLGAVKGPLVLRIRRLLSTADADEPSGRGGLMVLGTAVALAAAVMVLSMVSSATAQSPAPADAAERRVRRTDHFEISYAPSLDLHAERIGREAERAYEHVSGDLRHNLGFTIPLVLFESAADLQRSSQTGAANAPLRAGDQSDRILFRVDVPADQWLGLLTHEVAHVFGFDILPGNATPAWIAEGLAEYERNAWDPNDLVLLRDAVRANTVPRLTSVQPDGSKARLVEALGHAAFDFIESRWGKAGIRQFLLALRRSASGGGDPYEAAFRMPAGDFERGFDSYLRARLSDSAVAAAPRELDARSTVQLEGLIAATGVPAAAHLACIELLVTAASGAEQRWGIECGEARAEDVISALEPGQRVVITGTPTTARDVHRLVIRSLVRRSDGFVWRLPG
jgi:beta-lactamase regulating signal transducer with metallopeptidase domain